MKKTISDSVYAASCFLYRFLESFEPEIIEEDQEENVNEEALDHWQTP